MSNCGQIRERGVRLKDGELWPWEEKRDEGTRGVRSGGRRDVRGGAEARAALAAGGEGGGSESRRNGAPAVLDDLRNPGLGYFSSRAAVCPRRQLPRLSELQFSQECICHSILVCVIVQWCLFVCETDLLSLTLF